MNTGTFKQDFSEFTGDSNMELRVSYEQLGSIIAPEDWEITVTKVETETEMGNWVEVSEEELYCLDSDLPNAVEAACWDNWESRV